MKDCFNYTDNDLSELMHEQGKKRFGSECKHEKTIGGKCANCFRRVISKKELKH